MLGYKPVSELLLLGAAVILAGFEVGCRAPSRIERRAEEILRESLWLPHYSFSRVRDADRERERRLAAYRDTLEPWVMPRYRAGYIAGSVWPRVTRAESEQGAIGEAEEEAMKLFEMGRLRDAETRFTEILQEYRRLHGARHPDVATAMDNLAVVLHAEGQFKKAGPLHQEALATRRALLGDAHPDVQVSKNNLAVLLLEEGNYPEAESLFREVLSWRRAQLDERHPAVLTSTNNLAVALDGMGDYAAAEPLFRTVLEHRREVYGENDPQVAASLSNLAGWYYSTLDYEAAEPLLRRALEINESPQGDKSPAVASNLHALGCVLMAKGDSGNAEPLFRRALAIRRELLDNQHPDVAASLIELAQLLADKGEYAEAEPLFREGLVMQRKCLGYEHPDVASSLVALAKLLHKKGDFLLAESTYREALTVRRAIFGNQHPDVVESLDDLAHLLQDADDFESAETVWSEAAQVFEAARLRVSNVGLQRVRFAAEVSPMIAAAGCLAHNGKPLLAWERLEAGLARGLLDSVSARRSRPLSAEERRCEEELLGRLSKIDERIANLLGMPNPSAEARARIGELRKEHDQLEAEFAKLQAELAAKHGVAAGTVYELAHIQAQLPEDAALLGWVDVAGRSAVTKSAGQHWACVVRQEGEPIWVSLPGGGRNGEWTAADDQLPGKTREALRASSSDPGEVQELLAELAAQRLAPVGPHLGGIRHLIVLPAGVMAGIPIAALSDQYVVSYVPSGTMYAWLAEQVVGRREARREEPMSLLALGDPVYVEAAESDSQAAERVTLAPTRSTGDVGAWRHDAHHEPFVRLPGTRQEVNVIADLFAAQPDETTPIVVLTGPDASAHNLAELAAAGELQRFQYVHLAAHAVMDDRVAMRSALVLSQDEQPDAFERVLSGEEPHGRWLTAEQIVRTWKLNAELVTLSACETAMGRDAGGEGHWGFSQALLIAGARSLLLSLWKVDDTATLLLMTRFYADYLGQFDEPRGGVPPRTRMSKAVALREAQCWMRGLSAADRDSLITHSAAPSQTRGTDRYEPVTPATADHPYEHPYYWAAFVLIGDGS